MAEIKNSPVGKVLDKPAPATIARQKSEAHAASTRKPKKMDQEYTPPRLRAATRTAQSLDAHLHDGAIEIADVRSGSKSESRLCPKRQNRIRYATYDRGVRFPNPILADPEGHYIIRSSDGFRPPG